MGEKPRGFLSFRPIEASGLNKDDVYVWGAANFDGYIKGERTGGAEERSIRMR